MAYTAQRDLKYGIARINFCPDYFSERTLWQAMDYANKVLPPDYYADMSRYVPNQGKTWFHELLHIDWVSMARQYGNNKHITDIKMLVSVKQNDGKYRDRIIGAYQAVGTKTLARWGRVTGYWTIRNADSFAMFAMAKYVQKALGNIYPHLPLAPPAPKNVVAPDGRFVVPNLFTIYGNGSAELPDNTTVVDSLSWDPSDGTCVTSDDQDNGENQDDTITLVDTDLALESQFPSDYLSSWSSWAGLTPTTTSSVPSPTATWTMKIYRENDCSGDHYSLEGHHLDDLNMKCNAIHSGLTTDMSSPGVSCRWYTDDGNSWTDCDSSMLTHPLSWEIGNGICTIFSNDQCVDQGYFQAYSSSQGCVNYSEDNFDVENWVAFVCGAFTDGDDILRAVYTPRPMKPSRVPSSPSPSPLITMATTTRAY